MDLLRVNPWLTEIDLSHTPLEREGQAAQVRAQLERNAQDYIYIIQKRIKQHQNEMLD
jgi:hypothetical protein